jgi:hypothetical protein
MPDMMDFVIAVMDTVVPENHKPLAATLLISISLTILIAPIVLLIWTMWIPGGVTSLLTMYAIPFASIDVVCWLYYRRGNNKLFLWLALFPTIALLLVVALMISYSFL